MSPREHGILFSAPMVRAILDGTKTQTRRGMRLPAGSEGLTLTLREICEYPADRGGGLRAIFDTQEEPFSVRCPYGRVGDRMWVRETWRPCMEAWRTYVEYAAGGDSVQVHRDMYADLKKIALRFHGARQDVRSEAWHPSIHMPRWASRITLEITEVRVQRLHDISDEDIRAEGVTAEAVAALLGETHPHPDVLPLSSFPLMPLWHLGWTAINGEESWQANPWLWCLSFRRVQP